MTKILWVSDNSRLCTVGQSQVGRNLLSRFQKAGLEVVNLGFNEVPEREKAIEVTYPVRVVKRGENGIDKDHFIQTLKDDPGDVTVLSHDPFLFPVIDAIRPYCKRLVSYYTIDAEPLPNVWTKAFYYCDDVVVPTKYGRKIVRERFPDIDVKVIPYGVDSSKFKPFDAARRESARKNITKELSEVGENFGAKLEGKFVAIFYGHNQGKKNLLASSLAWEQFSKNKNDVVFLMITHSRLMNVLGWQFPGEFNLKDFVKIKDLLVVPVSLPEAGLSSLVGMADILLMPTIGEGWNMPATECMSAGTLPMTTYFAGPTDFLTNDNSFPLYKWVPVPGSFSTIRAAVPPEYIAARLEDAYKIWKTDQPKWQQMRQNAIDTAGKYNWDESAQQFIKLFNSPKVDRVCQLYQI